MPALGLCVKCRVIYRFADRAEVHEVGDAGTEYLQFSPGDELRIVSERDREAARTGHSRERAALLERDGRAQRTWMLPRLTVLVGATRAGSGWPKSASSQSLVSGLGGTPLNLSTPAPGSPLS